MKMHFLGAALLAMTFLGVSGDSFAGSPSEQIEEDVWIPFLAAATAFDAEGFLAVQSPDLVRVSEDTSEVYGLERYANEIRAGFKRARTRGLKRQSEMRFLSRTSSGDLAYQSGYFHSRATLPSGEEKVRYSRFEVVLRKENGKWKILLDKDTSDGGKITEAMYLRAQPMIGAAGTSKTLETQGPEPRL